MAGGNTGISTQSHHRVSEMTAMSARSVKRKKRTTVTIAIVLGVVAFASTFTVVLFHQTNDMSTEKNSRLDLRAQFLSPRNGTASSSLGSKTRVVPIGIEHFFWRGRQNRLVKLIQNVTNGRNNNNNHNVLLNFTIRCKRLHDKLLLGTGNLVLGYYAMRLAAAAGGVDFLFQCHQTTNITENVLRKQGSILSWLQGYFAAPQKDLPFSPFDPPLPTLKETARGMGHNPLHYMASAIRHDLRHMALQLVGPRVDGQQHKVSLSNATKVITKPLLPNVDMDDVAIHFRCGDVAKGFNSHDYGIVQFEAYRQYIPPAASTIGIVTTSFREASLRTKDQGTARVCEMLVTGLVEYLQHAFPRASISVRNGPNETLALAFARLIMANQTFCPPSTFSAFPAIASFGTSYIQRSNLTYFVVPIAEAYDDVTLLDGPMLSALEVGLYYVREQDEGKRSVNMLNWLVRPFCTLHVNVTEQVLMTCGNNTETT